MVTSLSTSEADGKLFAHKPMKALCCGDIWDRNLNLMMALDEKGGPGTDKGHKETFVSRVIHFTLEQLPACSFSSVNHELR